MWLPFRKIQPLCINRVKRSLVKAVIFISMICVLCELLTTMKKRKMNTYILNAFCLFFEPMYVSVQQNLLLWIHFQFLSIYFVCIFVAISDCLLEASENLLWNLSDSQKTVFNCLGINHTSEKNFQMVLAANEDGKQSPHCPFCHIQQH